MQRLGRAAGKACLRAERTAEALTDRQTDGPPTPRSHGPSPACLPARTSLGRSTPHSRPLLLQRSRTAEPRGFPPASDDGSAAPHTSGGSQPRTGTARSRAPRGADGGELSLGRPLPPVWGGRFPRPRGRPRTHHARRRPSLAPPNFPGGPAPAPPRPFPPSARLRAAPPPPPHLPSGPAPLRPPRRSARTSSRTGGRPTSGNRILQISCCRAY